MKPQLLVLCVLLTVPSPVSGQGAVPVGEEFQVNTYTTLDQANPDVAVGGDGEFVVVWHGANGFSEDYPDVAARLFDASSLPSSDPIRVNGITDGYQFASEAAKLPGGDFVVVWNCEYYPFYGVTIEGRRFTADGTLKTQFNVSPSFYPYAVYLEGRDVASAPDGSFMVVWSGHDTDDYTIYPNWIRGRRYSSDNKPDDWQQINTVDGGDQTRPRVDATPNNGFIVVWSSPASAGNDNPSRSIQMRRIDSTGTAIGHDFQVNTYTSSHQNYPDIAVSPSGEFLVTWQSLGSSGTDNDDYSIQARRFAVDGQPIGPDFQVNNTTADAQMRPRLAAHPDGDFVVIWESYSSAGRDSSGTSIQSRRVGSDGVPVGEEFQINSYTTDDQKLAAVEFDDLGRFVVTWQSQGSSGSDNSFASVQVQRFVFDCDDFGGDSDGDGACDDFDRCPGFDDGLDADGDGVPDDCDICLGDDATGDNDGDGFCLDLDCDDEDPDANMVDACGVCEGDDSSCAIFVDDFDSGDTSAWN